MLLRRLHRPLSLLAAGALLVVPTLGLPGSAWAAPTKEDKIAERESVDQQLEDLRLELEGVNDDLASTYLALAETELQIPIAQQDLEDAQAELAAAQEDDRLTGERLAAAEEEEAELSGEVEDGQVEVDRSDEELSQIALEAYKGGGLPNPSTIYFGGEEPQDAVDRSMNYRLTLASQGTRLDDLRSDQAVTENSADRLEAVREEIADLKIEAEAAVARTEAAEQAAADAKADLDALYATQITQRDDLEAKKTQYEGDVSTLETRSSTLDSEIEELARQERERAEREAAAAKKSSSSGGGGSSSSSSSGWVRPVDARLNSNFGWRVHPIYARCLRRARRRRALRPRDRPHLQQRCGQQDHPQPRHPEREADHHQLPPPAGLRAAGRGGGLRRGHGRLRRHDRFLDRLPPAFRGPRGRQRRQSDEVHLRPGRAASRRTAAERCLASGARHIPSPRR